MFVLGYLYFVEIDVSEQPVALISYTFERAELNGRREAGNVLL